MDSSNYLTKYEYARIIGIRAKELSEGNLPKIKTNETDFITIAILEFKEKKLDIIIERKLEDGTTVPKNIKDMLY